MDKLLMIGEEITRDKDALRLVEREEFEVLKARDREEGLGTFRAEHPAVILLDHQLGEHDGVELLKELRAEDPSCETILLTSAGETDAAIEVLRAGALDYLRQPTDMEQLRLALGRARERRQQKRAVEPPAVLVLEDHEPTRKRIARILEKEGYRVQSAADGEEGMRIFRERRFDLLLVDVRMPNKDGLEVLHETKGKGADVEVIVVTGYGDEDVVVQALRDGAINFLKKPVDIDQMLLALEKALEYQTARRSLAYRNRDMELMQELVVRLTTKLELIVETPGSISPEATRFLHHLVDALPFGVAVFGSDRRVIFANRHVTDKTDGAPTELETSWLQSVGIKDLAEEDLQAAFRRTMTSKPGSVETVVLSKWAFLVMTPLRLVRPDSTERFVALAIRGERGSQKPGD